MNGILIGLAVRLAAGVMRECGGEERSGEVVQRDGCWYAAVLPVHSVHCAHPSLPATPGRRDCSAAPHRPPQQSPHSITPWQPAVTALNTAQARGKSFYTKYLQSRWNGDNHGYSTLKLLFSLHIVAINTSVEAQ